MTLRSTLGIIVSYNQVSLELKNPTKLSQSSMRNCSTIWNKMVYLSSLLSMLSTIVEDKVLKRLSNGFTWTWKILYLLILCWFLILRKANKPKSQTKLSQNLMQARYRCWPWMVCLRLQLSMLSIIMMEMQKLHSCGSLRTLKTLQSRFLLKFQIQRKLKQLLKLHLIRMSQIQRQLRL